MELNPLAKKTLTLCVARFSHSLGKMETLNQEALQYTADVAHAFREQVHKNGGECTPLISDQMLAVFGASKASPHSTTNAVRACADFFLQRTNLLPPSSNELSIGIGLHWGECLFQKTTNGQDGAVLGTNVKIAEALSRKAGSGEILVTQTLLIELTKHLPEGWMVKKFKPKSAKSNEDPPHHPEGWSTLTIGPPDKPHLSFRHKFNLQLKDSSKVLPVSQVTRKTNLEVSLPKESMDKIEDRKTFGKYQLLSLVGEGGIGEVWKARDQFGNTVAIKTLLAGEGATQEQLQRFIQEAEIMSKLPHRGICRIHEVGVIDTTHYIAMEYIQGVPLSKILLYDSKKGDFNNETNILDAISDLEKAPDKFRDPHSSTAYNKIEIPQAVDITRKLCSAIQFAHDHNILHRDIKPHNIMLGLDGDPVIMDFGIAQMLQENQESPDQTQDRLFGTIEYMAPEQAMPNSKIDHRADVYSLGAVLYQMVTGRKHFLSSRNFVKDIKKLQSHEPVTPEFYNKTLPWELSAILLKSLKRHPAERYSSAQEFEKDLDNFQKGLPIMAQKPGVAKLIKKKTRQYKSAMFFSAFILFLILCFAGYLYLEEEKNTGNWISVFSRDFTNPKADLSAFDFKDGRNTKKVPPFEVTPHGFKVTPNQWCWIHTLPGITATSHIKIEVQLVFRNQPGPFTLSFNSASRPTAGPTDLPQGYHIIHAANDGSEDILYKIRIDREPTLKHHVISENYSNTPVTLSIVKIKDQIEYAVNNKVQISTKDFLTQRETEFHNIGFISASPSLYIQSLRIYRLSLPEKASPLIAAEALESTGHPVEAFEELLVISQDYVGTEVARSALVQAFRLTLEDSSLNKHQTLIKDLFLSQYSSSPEKALLMAIETIHLWQKEAFDTGLENLKEIYLANPNLNIFDQLPPHQLSQNQFQTYLDHLRLLSKVPYLKFAPKGFMGHDNLKDLRPRILIIDNFNIQSLSFISKMPLHSLSSFNNKIQTIPSLKQIPIKYWNGSTNQISDLTPLAESSLEVLDLSYNNIQSLKGLENAPIRILKLGHNSINSLRELKNLPLSHLDVRHNQIEDIAPLSASGVTELLLDHNNISQIKKTPYRHLKTLSLNYNPIEDVSSLRRTRVTHLSLKGTNVKTLSALKGMEFESLNLSQSKFKDYASLNVLSAKNLNLSRNKLDKLETIYSLELRSLNIESNFIRSLHSISHLQLTKLEAANNKISDWGPIKTMDLTYLNIEGNPIRSLAPFYQTPPDTFLFESPTLSTSEIQNAILHWKKIPKTNYNLFYGEIVLNIRKNNIFALKKMSMTLDGHRYLHIPRKVTWEQAKKICHSLKGHLVTISSSRENNFLLDVLQDNYPVWIGLLRNNSEWEWENGEPFTFHNTQHLVGNSMNMTPMYSGYSHNGQWILSESKTAGFIIEWDN